MEIRNGHHLVQFYESDEALLVENVAWFLATGYKSGSALVVVAAPPHVEAFGAALNAHDVPAEGAAMPRAEAMILWLRSKMPEQADRILTRARSYYTR
jgi:hypothetical protein